MFNGRGGDRRGAKNVILLFTDGHAADAHIALAVTKKMKSQGDHVMTVGFGPTEYINRFKKELETMSSNKEKDVFLGDVNVAERIAKRLVETSLPKSKFQFGSSKGPPSPKTLGVGKRGRVNYACVRLSHFCRHSSSPAI